MNWQAVVEQLRFDEQALRQKAADQSKHQAIQQSAAIVGAVLGRLADALEAGIRR